MISKKTVFFWVINIIIILAVIAIAKIKFFPSIASESFVSSSSAIFLTPEYIWLADYQSYIYQFDLQGNIVQKFNGGTNPTSVTQIANYIACTQDYGLTVINVQNSSTQVVPTGTLPVAAVNDGSHLWVANQQGNSFTVIDDVLWKPIQTSSVGYTPSSVAFDGTYMWFALTDARKVAIVDRSNYSVVTIPVGDSQNLPMKVFADPSQKFVFVLNTTSTIQKVTVNGVQDTINIPMSQYLGITSDGTTVFTGDAMGLLRGFSISTGQMTLGPISVGGIISDMAVDDKYVYVFSNSSNIFKKYNKQNGDLTFTFSLL